MFSKIRGDNQTVLFRGNRLSDWPNITARGPIDSLSLSLKDSPDEMIFDYWQEKAFPNQPIGRSILGKIDIIKSISRDEVKNFMMSHYNPNKMIISAAGKINHDEFVEAIKKSCTNLPQGTVNGRLQASYKAGEYRE